MLNLKHAILWVVRRLGYEIVRKSVKCKNTLNVLDLAVNIVKQSEKQFFFMQIGANDGVRNDPLYSIIKTYHFKGVLVEPLPDKFEHLQLNYATERQLKFENCAIAAENGECTLFRVRHDSPYPTYTQRFASLYKEHLKKHGIEEKYIEQLRVPSCTFASLLEKYQIDTLSLLQIDTEGFDYEIIKMAFASSCFPRILFFEHFHLSSDDRVACWQTLADNGYRFVEIGYDTLAIREE